MHFIVGIDTSGKGGSIALGRGDQRDFELLESVPIQGGTFSAQLIPQLAALLKKHAVEKQEVFGLAATSGPGSFTGLRVGLAAVKALAEVLRKPIATVSLLEAMAAISGRQGKVATALDAGRGEVYAGEFEVNGESAAVVREVVLARRAFVERAQAAGLPVLTPDDAVVGILRGAGLAVEEVARPGSDVVARLGLSKILAGETVTPEALDANYIRRSDAEIFARK